MLRSKKLSFTYTIGISFCLYLGYNSCTWCRVWFWTFVNWWLKLPVVSFILEEKLEIFYGRIIVFASKNNHKYMLVLKLFILEFIWWKDSQLIDNQSLQYADRYPSIALMIVYCSNALTLYTTSIMGYQYSVTLGTPISNFQNISSSVFLNGISLIGSSSFFSCLAGLLISLDFSTSSSSEISKNLN